MRFNLGYLSNPRSKIRRNNAYLKALSDYENRRAVDLDLSGNNQLSRSFQTPDRRFIDDSVYRKLIKFAGEDERPSYGSAALAAEGLIEAFNRRELTEPIYNTIKSKTMWNLRSKLWQIYLNHIKGLINNGIELRQDERCAILAHLF